MKLNELAAACKLYDEKTNFDDSYIDFIKSIDYSLDLTKPLHRQYLLKWLNRWACRQFAKNIMVFSQIWFYSGIKNLVIYYLIKIKISWN